jgi:hypothetical protein
VEINIREFNKKGGKKCLVFIMIIFKVKPTFFAQDKPS